MDFSFNRNILEVDVALTFILRLIFLDNKQIKRNDSAPILKLISIWYEKLTFK